MAYGYQKYGGGFMPTKDDLEFAASMVGENLGQRMNPAVRQEIMQNPQDWYSEKQGDFLNGWPGRMLGRNMDIHQYDPTLEGMAQYGLGNTVFAGKGVDVNQDFMINQLRERMFATLVNGGMAQEQALALVEQQYPTPQPKMQPPYRQQFAPSMYPDIYAQRNPLNREGGTVQGASGGGSPQQLSQGYYEDGGKVKTKNKNLDDLIDLIGLDSQQGAVPIMAHQGEFVMNKEAADMIGQENLNQLNELAQMRQYQEGGIVVEEMDINSDGGSWVRMPDQRFYYVDPSTVPSLQEQGAQVVSELIAPSLTEARRREAAAPTETPETTKPAPPTTGSAETTEPIGDQSLANNPRAAELLRNLQGVAPQIANNAWMNPLEQIINPGAAPVDPMAAAIQEDLIRSGATSGLGMWPGREGAALEVPPAPPADIASGSTRQAPLPPSNNSAEVTGRRISAGREDLQVPPAAPADIATGDRRFPTPMSTPTPPQQTPPTPQESPQQGLVTPPTPWRQEHQSLGLDMNFLQNATPEEAMVYLQQVAQNRESPGLTWNERRQGATDPLVPRQDQLFNQMVQQYAGIKGLPTALEAGELANQLTSAQARSATTAANVAEETEGAQARMIQNNALLKDIEVNWAQYEEPARMQMLDYALDQASIDNALYGEFKQLELNKLRAEEQQALAQIGALRSTQNVLDSLSPKDVASITSTGFDIYKTAIENQEALVGRLQSSLDTLTGDAEEIAQRAYQRELLKLRMIQDPETAANMSIADYVEQFENKGVRIFGTHGKLDPTSPNYQGDEALNAALREEFGFDMNEFENIRREVMQYEQYRSTGYAAPGTTGGQPTANPYAQQYSPMSLEVLGALLQGVANPGNR